MSKPITFDEMKALIEGEGGRGLFSAAWRFGKVEALKEAAHLVREGGCTCPRAPCLHDEAGEVYASKLAVLATRLESQ